MPALRALDWQHTEIEQHAPIGEALKPYVFTYTNSGPSAVSITDVRVSCGCLEPELDRKIIPPGESGTLRVGFDRTGLVGEIARTVTVLTDENRKDPYQLILRADLPEALTLAPRLVHWRKEAPAAVKSVDIKVNLAEGVEITRAICNRDDINVSLVTIEAGRHYRLDLTPRGTAETRLAIITLQTTQPLPAGTALTVYAQIR